MTLKMYGFFRSGTSHRTRIVLNLKNIEYAFEGISLAKNEHKTADFKMKNPQGFVPVLEIDSAHGSETLLQSPAMIEWLEEQYPEPALLPKDVLGREKVRALAAMIGCDMHPINNKRILEYLRNSANFDESAIEQWCQHWIEEGLQALEQILSADTERGDYCYANQVSIADAYLIPQVDSAKRFKVDMHQYPNIQKIYTTCMALPAFQKAAPQNQPDAI